MIFLARVVAWLLLAAIGILMLLPPNLRPVTAMPHSLEHLVVFLLVGGAFALGYRRQVNSVGLMLVLFSGVLELLQMLMPGRHARLSDFLVDAAGACVGIAVATLFDRVKRPGHRQP